MTEVQNPQQGHKEDHHHLGDKLKLPFRELRDKLHNSQHLHNAKVRLIHKKHTIGKFANLFNPQHRHDEEHEKACDEKRTRICESHRFQSYFPEREGNVVKCYVDGRDYFWAVSMALEEAKETIYICDWWLSPELFLRRPPSYNREWRLDRVLKRRAEAGVKIYVIVYREVEAALTCNSDHTKQALRALCPEGTPGHGNIKIMRHPDHNVLENAADMTFYWAHHEKFIVIDYELAFIGGMDLCFGRWDIHQHPLSDMHPENVHNEVWPGQDFNNNRVMDFKNVDDWKQNELNKEESGRMPWHDVSVSIVGPAVYDIAEHFVLRWNFVKRDKYKRDKRFEWLELQGRQGEDENLVGVQRPAHPVGGYTVHPLSPLDSKLPLLSLNDDRRQPRGTVRAQLVRSSADWSSGILTEHSIQNAYSTIIREAQHYIYIENQFFITATGEHQPPIRNTIGRAIVDAVLRAAREGRKFRVIVLLPAAPGFAGDLRDDAAIGTRAIMDYQYQSICRGEHSIFKQIEKEGVDPEEYLFFFNLRSYDRLNRTPDVKARERKAGVKYRDVQRAEAEELMPEGIHGTANAEGRVDGDAHMGKTGGKRGSSSKAQPDGVAADPDSLNGERSQEDALQKFEATSPGSGPATNNNTATANGNNHDDNTSNTNASNDKTKSSPTPHDPAYATVAHHAMAHQPPLSSIPWDHISDANSSSCQPTTDPDDPVQAEIHQWIQEELYIHSKLLIVDDRIMICGSSNLNDRSQLGERDSELSVVLEDEDKVQGVMDGKPYEAGRLMRDLRLKLWREHLGMARPQALNAEGDPAAMPPGWEVDGEKGKGGEKDGKGVGDEDDEEAEKLVEDPLSDELWDLWTKRATQNTLVFRQLFHADPDDHVKTFDDYNGFMPARGVRPGHIFDRMMPAHEARKKLDTVRGHLVWMPLQFLRNAPMAEKGLQVNQWTESVYT
ncbi:hypothetical protein VTJ49DRAFT_4856 [Mycothermus thermophilus]|uniref:Phospholipase n=1 Tax=Humicola insolens TaxID=85995 RepID=A0ABR3VL07_HUMIN